MMLLFSEMNLSFLNLCSTLSTFHMLLRPLAECRNKIEPTIDSFIISRSIRIEATADEMNVVRKLAAYILEKIQENLILLPNMIVASIVLQHPTGIYLGKMIIVVEYEHRVSCRIVRVMECFHFQTELLTKKYETILEWCKKCGIPVARNGKKYIYRISH